MTLNQARKILGKSGEGLSDEELEQEIETASMIAEIVMMKYREERNKIDVQLNQNA